MKYKDYLINQLQDIIKLLRKRSIKLEKKELEKIGHYEYRS